MLVAATVLDYLAWLAWDQTKDVNPVTSKETGPYESWQVIGVGALLLLLALVAGWQRHPVLAIAVIPTVFTACWVLDAATEPTPDANLWPIGAAFLATGCLLGAVTCATIGFAARVIRDRRIQAATSGPAPRIGS
jgi:hypothetical protein